ncbi:Holliday junction branch migration protein RuvA [Sulfurihydrogenibium sp.]|uniref:Holliday junction branch migration protein RuvA n=1 Tax=Sulfurihydrogenibium sp. TaxID=2053621 RepID=UPI002606F986|nr:Holliday junction branch migration protein RuvA [Sulfurihydrogenibium sp.]
MFDYISGKIKKIDKNKILIEKYGFGFLVNVPDSEKFLEEDTVYTVLKIKEDEIRLIGFKTKEEREIFNLLLQIHGVGEKHALSILSVFSVDEFQSILEEADINSLIKVQGIGKKTAQRIVVELKGKLSFENELVEDLAKTLINLGYDKESSYRISKTALKQFGNIEEALKFAIQELSNSTK